MERIAAYFEHIPSSHRSLILVGGIAFFWLIESAVPLFRFGRTTPGYSKWKHGGINLFFTLTTVLVNFSMAFLLLKASQWAISHHVGVLSWVSWPLWAEALVGLMLLDLIGAWLPHWTEHQAKALWRFHLIHHSDTQVDTTTANRHHPGESVLRFGFTLLAVGVAGTPLWLVFLYQALSVVAAQFNHANIQLPEWLNRPLSWVLVTPNMHHIHHHYVLPVTNTNYGNIFSWWDRLFGTYYEMPQHAIQYGIDTHPSPAEHAHIGPLLAMPFGPYREPVGESALAYTSEELPTAVGTNTP